MTAGGGERTAEVAPATHPGPASVSLPAPLRAALVEHARAGYPNEACGIVVGDRPAADGGRALRFLPTRNAAASPFRYEIDRGELLQISLETDDRDETIWAIFHSHTHSPARPSPTDVALAFYPDALYLLVSLDPAEADPATAEPGLRAWRIVGGEMFEVGLEAGAGEAGRAGEAGEGSARPGVARAESRG